MSSTARRPWLSLREVSSHVGHHYSTIFRALKPSDLPAYQRYAGASWRVHLDALEVWLRGAAGCNQLQDPRLAAS